MDDTQLLRQFELLKKLTRYSEDSQLTAIQTLLNIYLNEVSDNCHDIYTRFIDEYERVKEFIAFRELANKNIIVTGGKFKAGKSSFLNSIYDQKNLPCNIRAYSSVPVYITSGNDSVAYLLNRFDSVIKTDSSDIHDTVADSDISIQDTQSLGHLIKSMLIYTASLTLKHIVFLDTPGYLIPSDKEYCDRTKEASLISRLNHGNYILWFADIGENKTTISDYDIELLKKLNPDIPKLIIINKADTFTSKELSEVVEKTKKLLSARSLQFIDVLTYSCISPEKYDKYKILAYFDRWNKTSSVVNFNQIFENIFDTLMKHRNTKSNVKISEFKQRLMPEIKKISNDIYDIKSVFQTNNTDGFVSLDSLHGQKDSDNKEKNDKKNPFLKNLDLSKLKLSEMPIANPEKLFRKYNDDTVTDISEYERYINSVSIMLNENMKNISSVFNIADGGAQYSKEVASIIVKELNIDLTTADNEPDGKNNDRIDKMSASSEAIKPRTRSSRSSQGRSSVSERLKSNSEETSERKPIRHERPASRAPRRGIK